MLIQFGQLSIHLIFPLFYGLSCYFRSYANNNDPNSPLISLILSSFCEISIGLLEVISIYLRRKKKVRQSLIVDITTYSFNFIENTETYTSKKKLKTHLIIFLLSLTNFLFCFLVFSLGSQKEFTTYNFQNEIRFVGIFYVLFLTSKVFKRKLFFHHKLSIFIILLSTIGLSLIGIFTITAENVWLTLCKFGLMLLCDLYFSSKHTVEKVLMDNYFISPFYLLFIEGIFSILIDVSLFGIFTQMQCHSIMGFCRIGKPILDFPDFINSLRIHYIFCLIFFFFSIGVELFITITIKIYTPAYTPIFDFLSTFLSLFSNIPTTTEGLHFFVSKAILYLIIGFSALVFNEIIILNFWGLNNDIHQKIEQRSDEDFKECILGLEKNHNSGVGIIEL